MIPPLHIAQHKRFVPYSTHPNSALYTLFSRQQVLREIFGRTFIMRAKSQGLEGWASFMLITLYEIPNPAFKNGKYLKVEKIIQYRDKKHG
jgi:hypothetical protein